MNPVPPYRPAPLSWWLRLLTRSPEDLAAERLARMPAPAPRTPNAQEGPKFGLQRTQAGRVGYPTAQAGEANHEH